jgi:hypothetical protein
MLCQTQSAQIRRMIYTILCILRLAVPTSRYLKLIEPCTAPNHAPANSRHRASEACTAPTRERGGSGHHTGEKNAGVPRAPHPPGAAIAQITGPRRGPVCRCWLWSSVFLHDACSRSCTEACAWEISLFVSRIF